MFFALNLADKHLLPAEPVYILFETAGHRIDRAQTVLNLIWCRVCFDIMTSGIVCQMVKRYIITHITFIFRIADLIFFRDAGTDKCKLVCDFQIFLRIDCRTHQRALDWYKFGNQLRYVMFNVVDYCRAWLGDSPLEIVLRNVFDVSPCRDIRAKTYADNSVYA